MSKRLPIRYVSESAVKHALKIDTFREMSKDKIMQFASMIPYMNKDVAIAIINQFPMLADFGKNATEVERKTITEDMISVSTPYTAYGVALMFLLGAYKRIHRWGKYRMKE